MLMRNNIRSPLRTRRQHNMPRGFLGRRRLVSNTDRFVGGTRMAHVRVGSRASVARRPGSVRSALQKQTCCLAIDFQVLGVIQAPKVELRIMRHELSDCEWSVSIEPPGGRRLLPGLKENTACLRHAAGLVFRRIRRGPGGGCRAFPENAQASSHRR